jgi:hypothetical protein
VQAHSVLLIGWHALQHPMCLIIVLLLLLLLVLLLLLLVLRWPVACNY